MQQVVLLKDFRWEGHRYAAGRDLTLPRTVARQLIASGGARAMGYYDPGPARTTRAMHPEGMRRK